MQQTKGRGFSLVEILVSVSVALIGIFGVNSMYFNLYSTQQRIAFTMNMSQIRINLQQPLMNSVDWAATIANNPGMACFQGPQKLPCLYQTQKPGAPWPMKLYSRSGLVYDSSNKQSGFTITGAGCTTYGVGDCALHPILAWQLECNLSADPSCSSPLVSVDLGYAYSGPDIGKLNYSSYGFHLMIPTFPIIETLPCPSTGIPACSLSQQPICVAGTWTCEEYSSP